MIEGWFILIRFHVTNLGILMPFFEVTCSRNCCFGTIEQFVCIFILVMGEFTCHEWWAAPWGQENCKHNGLFMLGHPSKLNSFELEYCPPYKGGLIVGQTPRLGWRILWWKILKENIHWQCASVGAPRGPQHPSWCNENNAFYFTRIWQPEIVDNNMYVDIHFSITQSEAKSSTFLVTSCCKHGWDVGCVVTIFVCHVNHIVSSVRLFAGSLKL